MIAPVVGQLFPDDTAIKLGTGYSQFRCWTFKMDGLCKVNGRHIEILAIVSNQPGQGMFREFVRALKPVYDSITFWADMNPILSNALHRYGFVRVDSVDSDGSRIRGWQWVHPSHEITSQLRQPAC